MSRAKYIIMYYMKDITGEGNTDLGIYIEVDKDDLMKKIEYIENNPLIIKYFVVEGTIYKKVLGKKHDVIQDLIIIKKGKMYV